MEIICQAFLLGIFLILTRPYKLSKQTIKSKELRIFYSNQWRLESGRLPDMRFQDINFETDIQKRVDSFMDGNELVGLLIGSTGSDKTHEIINRAKKQFTIFIDV
ncbi:hypothetical protein QVD99_006638 [Batrachochytrium dendrobatidis]|nr:hypothetical protein QVD99_006638 [Batrachochytrium dendrobatidis]